MKRCELVGLLLHDSAPLPHSEIFLPRPKKPSDFLTRWMRLRPASRVLPYITWRDLFREDIKLYITTPYNTGFLIISIKITEEHGKQTDSLSTGSRFCSAENYSSPDQQGDLILTIVDLCTTRDICSTKMLQSLTYRTPQ